MSTTTEHDAGIITDALGALLGGTGHDLSVCDTIDEMLVEAQRIANLAALADEIHGREPFAADALGGLAILEVYVLEAAIHPGADAAHAAANRAVRDALRRWIVRRERARPGDADPAFTAQELRRLGTLAALQAWTLGEFLNDDRPGTLLASIDALNGCADLARWARDGGHGPLSARGRDALRDVRTEQLEMMEQGDPEDVEYNREPVTLCDRVLDATEAVA